MRIAYFLLSKKGFKTIEVLIENNLIDSGDSIIIGRDKNIINDYSKCIEKLCIENKIIYTFDKKTTSLNFDLAIAVSWRWLINTKKQLIVLHDSILPKYRGFAPLVDMLINEEKEIGVTALYAVENYDEGPIILQEKIAIGYPIKIDEAIDIVIALYQSVILNIIRAVKKENILPHAQKQNHLLASYSLWRDNNDYKINWNWDASKIVTFINAVGFPYNGAYSILDEKKVKISNAELLEDLKIENRDVGKIIFIKQNKPVVVCGSGLLKINTLRDYDSNTDLLPLKKFRLKFC